MNLPLTYIHLDHIKYYFSLLVAFSSSLYIRWSMTSVGGRSSETRTSGHLCCVDACLSLQFYNINFCPHLFCHIFTVKICVSEVSVLTRYVSEQFRTFVLHIHVLLGGFLNKVLWSATLCTHLFMPVCMSLSAQCFSNFIFHPSSIWFCDPRLRSCHLPRSWTLMKKTWVIKISLSRCQKHIKSKWEGFDFSAHCSVSFDGCTSRFEVWFELEMEMTNTLKLELNEKFTFLSVCCGLDNLSDILLKYVIQIKSTVLLFCDYACLLMYTLLNRK